MAVKTSRTTSKATSKKCPPGKCIVKRHGKTEIYDERKVYASCYAACVNTQIDRHEAEKICSKVTAEISHWVHREGAVTSKELFPAITKAIRKHNRHAAFMYETHRDIS